jgi:hypothetical protein
MMAQVEAVERVAFAPITRIDAAAREIEVTATSEALDAYGTVFDYAASKDAFQRWMGNVREMHANVAVGKRMAVICDDAARQIRVRLKISRGAASTWEKILDGTLCGASIGATNVVWRETRRTDGGGTPLAEPVRVATAYDLVELSLVDNPANPDCVGIAVMRGLVADEEVLDEIEGDGPTPGPSPSADGEGRRGPTPDPAPSEMERGDAGRDEVGQERDESRPYKEQREMTGQGGRGTEAGVVEARVLAAARNAATGVALLRGVVERMAAEQAAALDEVRARLARIEAQPMPGGPMLRAAEKVLGAPMGNPAMNVAERIAALQEFGAGRTDQRAQVEVAAEILRLQRGFGE